MNVIKLAREVGARPTSFFNGSAWNTGPSERLLVVAPHPDDEVIGACGLIYAAFQSGSRVKVVYYTDGDYNPLSAWFFHHLVALSRRRLAPTGRVRRREAKAAMALLGLTPGDLHFFGFPDGGLMRLWRRRASEPIAALCGVMREYQPTQIITTSFFDAHPDHRAVFWFAHAAYHQAMNSASTVRRLVYSVRARPLVPYLETMRLRTIFLSLDAECMELKRLALEKHQSQMSYNRKFLMSFVRSYEHFYEVIESGIAKKNKVQCGSYAECISKK